MWFQLARQHLNITDKILQAFSKIAKVLPRLDRLKTTFGDIEDFQRVLALIYSDILEFNRRVYKFFRGRAWHLWFAIAWGHFERRFDGILGNLEAHCDLLDKEAAAVHFSEMKRTREIAELRYEEFEQSRDTRMAREVFSWLSAAEDSQEDYLHNLADIRQPKTCNWILDDDQIFSWIEDENGDAIIWMTAIPGAGKSFLCSLLVENLENLHKDITTLYYFCKSSEKDSCRSVLCTLATQILRQNLDMAPLVHQAYLQKGSGHSIPTMKKMLKDILSTIKSTRIVLDGIDECSDSVQKEVLNSLSELQKHAGDNCKLLVSSRLEPQIDKAIPRRNHIALDGKTTGAIQLYIQSKVVELKDYFPSFEPILFQEIEKRLKENAKGMFLWVRLVISMLKDRGSESEVEFENAIEQLPEGLDEAYGLIIKRIDSLGPALKARAFKILFWVCSAFRPIKIHEVADGIALKPGQTVLSKKTRCQDMKRDILDICAPIIERTNSGVLDLVHISAKEYLLDNQSGPFVDVAKAHFNIAFSCITNLTSASEVFVPRFSDGITEPDLENFVVQGSYGLQSYGHQYWAEHVRAYFGSISDLDDQAKILIRALDTFSKVRRHGSGPSSKPTLFEGLQKLVSFPRIHGITVDWLFFRSQLDQMGPFESVEAQQDWQLQKDETFLSLVDCRLREITERLLTMDSSNLPTHVGKKEFLAFIERFGFLCRFHGCNHHFESTKARSAHEVTHVTLYPCLQCDFSGSGFTSRKDLETHTRKYHMSIEDFKIPTSLYTTDSGQSSFDSSIKGGVIASTRSSRCWNEQGREVLQRSFRQVLARLKSEITPVKEGSNQQSSNNPFENQPVDSTSESTSNPDILSMSLNGIQTKIDEQRYQSLTEFKEDIRRVSIDSRPEGSFEKSKIMEQSCDEELEEIFKEYPAFANFIPKTFDTSGHVIHGDLSDDNYDSIQPEFSNSHTESLESPGIYFASPKTPYWSSTEEKEFPKLLEQYGREFIRISDYLKTKTADDVKEHFSHLLSIGRGDLSILADATDAKLQLESQPPKSIPVSTDILPGISSITDRLNDSSQLGANYLTQPLAASSADLHPEFLSGRSNDQGRATNTSNSGASDRPKRCRRPPRRAKCGFCNDHPNGLHNEHTLNKHIARYHKKTRKVWTCMDASIDNNFLARCKKCSAAKPYRTELNAAKHLREVHFTAKTPKETLRRWMKEIEEENPNFKKDRSTSSVTNEPNQLPRLYEALKPEKTSKGPDSGKDLNRLPALQNRSDEPDNSSRPPSAMSSPRSDLSSKDKATSKEIESDSGSLDDDMFLPNVSFDNLLPGFDSISAQIRVDSSFGSVDRAFIRPDQVPRFPNLHQLQKAACQDQVDTLYETIRETTPTSQRHKEAIEDLRSLSRTLRKRLLNWQHQSSHAPKLPYSV